MEHIVDVQVERFGEPQLLQFWAGVFAQNQLRSLVDLLNH